MADRHAVALFMIGIAVGTGMKVLPAPVDIATPYIGLIFLALGIILLIKG
ncbi:MAG: hypothetical protein AABW72_06315 [archaeon]